MKLNNLPLLRKRMAILGITALAGVTAAQAQFTGIGTTTPDAGLHVAPTTTPVQDTTTFNVIKVESIRRAGSYNQTAYSSVLMYDPGTGLFRHREIDDLLQANNEWIVLDGGTATERIVPRRYATAMDINATGVNVAVNTDIQGDFNVGAFPTTLGGSLTATGAATLNSTLVVAGELTLNTVANSNPVTGTSRVLVQNGSNAVTHVTVDELLASSAFWVNSGTALAPNYQPRGIETSLSIAGDNIGIGSATKLTLGLVDQETAPTNASQVLIQDGGEVKYVTVEDLVEQNGIWEYDNTTTPTLVRPRLFPGAMTVNDALTTMNSTTTTVTSNVGITGTVDITGNTGITGELTLNAPANAAPVVDADKVLLQQDGSNLVEHVTVAQLMANSSYWDYDGTELRPSGVAATDIVITSGNVAIASSFDVVGASTIAGTFDVTGASTVAGTFDVTGNTSVIGTLLVTPGADGVTIQDVTPVTDVVTAGVAGTPSLFERVLITDHEGVVRYITADNLVSSAAEWVYDDTNDRIYARRAEGLGADVWVTDIGNHVVEIAAAYQFADATNQVTATAITSSTGYAINTAATEDVSFNEDGRAWMHFAAANVDGDQGRVGIGTNTPLASLHVQGNVIASHTAQTSDERFKRNIQEFTGALATVNAMRGVSYNFRSDEFPSENFDDAEHLGFIAQELQKVLPQTVFERGDGYLTVDYSAVTPVLVEAVQELSAQVTALQAENASLRTSSPAMGDASTISKLEARLADLDARLAEVAGRK